jgi:hypothetical protein
MTSKGLAFTNGTRTPLVFCLFARRINYPLARRRVVTGLGPFLSSPLFATTDHPLPCRHRVITGLGPFPSSPFYFTTNHPSPGAGSSRDRVPSRLVLYFPPQTTPRQLWVVTMSWHSLLSRPAPFSAKNYSSSNMGSISFCPDSILSVPMFWSHTIPSRRLLFSFGLFQPVPFCSGTILSRPIWLWSHPIPFLDVLFPSYPIYI